MHLRAYARRPDVHAVVRAHPRTAAAFPLAGEGFTAPPLPEIILEMGHVALVPFALPGSAVLADGFEPFWAEHDALLMANHGVTTLGSALAVAHRRMESLEHGARIILTARLLGRVIPLDDSHQRALLAARERSRLGGAESGRLRPAEGG